MVGSLECTCPQEPHRRRGACERRKAQDQMRIFDLGRELSGVLCDLKISGLAVQPALVIVELCWCLLGFDGIGRSTND
jgi:hypothetical protein